MLMQAIAVSTNRTALYPSQDHMHAELRCYLITQIMKN